MGCTLKYYKNKISISNEVPDQYKMYWKADLMVAKWNARKLPSLLRFIEIKWHSKTYAYFVFFYKQFALYTGVHSTSSLDMYLIFMIIHLFYVKMYFLYVSSISDILSFSVKSFSWNRSLYKCILLPSQVPSGDIAHSSVDGELKCNTRSPDSLCESLERSALLIFQ